MGNTRSLLCLFSLRDVLQLCFREKQINKPRPFFASCEGKTFKDGEYLPFTFDAEDFIAARKKFRKSEIRSQDKDKNPIPANKKWSGRNFTHDFVFGDVKEEEAHIMELPWYYDISSWDKLKKWLNSDNSLDKPKEVILSYSEWNPIGVDNEQK